MKKIITLTLICSFLTGTLYSQHLEDVKNQENIRFYFGSNLHTHLDTVYWLTQGDSMLYINRLESDALVTLDSINHLRDGNNRLKLYSIGDDLLCFTGKIFIRWNSNFFKIEDAAAKNHIAALNMEASVEYSKYFSYKNSPLIQFDCFDIDGRTKTSSVYFKIIENKMEYYSDSLPEISSSRSKHVLFNWGDSLVVVEYNVRPINDSLKIIYNDKVVTSAGALSIWPTVSATKKELFYSGRTMASGFSADKEYIFTKDGHKVFEDYQEASYSDVMDPLYLQGDLYCVKHDMTLNKPYGSPRLYRRVNNAFTKVTKEYIEAIVKYKGEIYVSTAGSHGAELKKLTNDLCLVTGKIIYDMDNNCQSTQIDQPIETIVMDKKKGMISNSNKTGQYYFFIRKDTTYNFKALRPIQSNEANCNSNSLSLTPTNIDSVYEKNFYLKLDTTITDLELSIGGSIFIRGFKHTGNITIQNKNANSYELVVVELVLDSRLSKFDSPYAFTKEGNKVKFTVPIVDGFGKELIPYSFTISTFIKRNEKVSISTQVIVGDRIKFNNYDTLCQHVRGAYDPNVKVSFPAGAITTPVGKIDYTIQFQNVGNYKATNVRVVDTLDPRLPIEYIRIKGTSHPESYSLEVRNNVLIWTFSGIELADSASDPEGSKGYICYEAKVRSVFLKQGDQIDNKAEIYFDYEKPVTTDFASVYLRDDTSFIFELEENQKIICYPNPSNGRFTIQNKINIPSDIKVYNLYGALILKTIINASSSVQVSLEGEANGMYIVKNEHGVPVKIIKN